MHDAIHFNELSTRVQELTRICFCCLLVLLAAEPLQVFGEIRNVPEDRDQTACLCFIEEKRKSRSVTDKYTWGSVPVQQAHARSLLPI